MLSYAKSRTLTPISASIATVGCSDCLGLLRNTGIPEPLTGLGTVAAE